MRIPSATEYVLPNKKNELLGVPTVQLVDVVDEATMNELLQQAAECFQRC
jgi:hypothetical protein